MQVILVQDVQHLGSLGDLVQVKDGFARNYLLPRGMAIVATSKRSGQIEHQRKRLDGLRQIAIEKAQAESDKVTSLKLVVQAKAGVNGKLFGSVTNRDVQAALAEQGYELDRRSIQLHTLIKSVGNFTATVRLHTDVKVDVGITVEALGESVAAEAVEGGQGADGEAADATADETADETGSEAAEGAAGETGSEAADAADADAMHGDAAAPADSPDVAQAAPTEDGATQATPTEDGAAADAQSGAADDEQPEGDQPEVPGSGGDTADAPSEQN